MQQCAGYVLLLRTSDGATKGTDCFLEIYTCVNYTCTTMTELNWRIILGVFLLYTVFVFALWGENETTDVSLSPATIGNPVRVETIQGGSFQGVLKAISGDRIEIVAEDGQILQIDLNSIVSVQILDSSESRHTFFRDSASNRLVVMPTGFPMETGEFHVADQEIIAVTVSYGLNDHVSFWAGLSVPGFLLSARYILSPAERFAISVGSFAGLSWIEDLQAGAILPYLIASWGEPDNNVTIGGSPVMTFDLDRSKPFELSGAVLALGGKKVLTSTSSLIFENWIMWLKRDVYDNSIDPVDKRWDAVPNAILPAVVFRIAGERLSWDIGAVVPLLITNAEFVIVDPEASEEEEIGYNKNTGYKLQGVFDEAIIPIPILSVTYRID